MVLTKAPVLTCDHELSLLLFPLPCKPLPTLQRPIFRRCTCSWVSSWASRWSMTLALCFHASWRVRWCAVNWARNFFCCANILGEGRKAVGDISRTERRKAREKLRGPGATLRSHSCKAAGLQVASSYEKIILTPGCGREQGDGPLIAPVFI